MTSALTDSSPEQIRAACAAAADAAPAWGLTSIPQRAAQLRGLADSIEARGQA
ncbi:MAG TPA: aldehyde dehydrogenase family protein [Roseateles sp.]